MKRVFRSLLPVAMATTMVGLVITPARADRITLNGGCLGLSCSRALTGGGGSLSFGALSFAEDIATANADDLEVASEVVADSDHGVSPAAGQKAAKVSVMQLDALENRNRPTSNAVDLLNNSMWWSFSSTHTVLNGTLTSASMALPISNSRSESFSVVVANIANAPIITSASAKAGTKLQTNGLASTGADLAPNHAGEPSFRGSVVPEPTTMLLFGTGLVGLAAILRKRLRVRRASSK